MERTSGAKLFQFLLEYFQDELFRTLGELLHSLIFHGKTLAIE